MLHCHCIHVHSVLVSKGQEATLLLYTCIYTLYFVYRLGLGLILCNIPIHDLVLTHALSPSVCMSHDTGGERKNCHMIQEARERTVT